MKKAVAALAVCLFMTGCVSVSTTYNTVKDKYSDAKAAYISVHNDMAAVAADIEDAATTVVKDAVTVKSNAEATLDKIKEMPETIMENATK
jgi:uncharacterized protein YceK